MGLRQSIDGVGETCVGPEGGVRVGAVGRPSPSGKALVWIKARYADGTPPLLRLPEQTGDLAGIDVAARRQCGAAARRHRGLTSRRCARAPARRSLPILADRPAEKCHPRTTQLDRIDEASLGELLMHFMQETIVAA